MIAFPVCPPAWWSMIVSRSAASAPAKSTSSGLPDTRNTIPGQRNKLPTSFTGEQGWHSGESTRLPPIWPLFDSWPWRHMWVKFVVGSLLCSKRFFLRVLRFFPSPPKPTFPNSNWIWNARTSLNEFSWAPWVPWVNKLHYCEKFKLCLQVFRNAIFTVESHASVTLLACTTVDYQELLRAV